MEPKQNVNMESISLKLTEIVQNLILKVLNLNTTAKVLPLKKPDPNNPNVEYNTAVCLGLYAKNRDKKTKMAFGCKNAKELATKI